MTSNNCSRIQGAANKGKNLLDKTNRNELKQRKFFVDKDVASIFGESAAGSLTSEEKRILNFIVEHGSINVSECLRLLPTLPKWHAAKRLLESMRIKGYLLHKHSLNVLRDAHARYVLAIGPDASTNQIEI